jgi:hypothetical protein
MKRQSLLLVSLIILDISPRVQAQFTFRINNGTITITRYTGTNGAVVVPDTITGLPVTSIGSYAFSDSTNLTTVTLPESVNDIGSSARLLKIVETIRRKSRLCAAPSPFSAVFRPNHVFLT